MSTSSSKRNRASRSKGGKQNLYAWPPTTLTEIKHRYPWRKIVVMDCDEVIAGWLKAFAQYINGLYNYNLDPDTLNRYHLQFISQIGPEQFNVAFDRFAEMSPGGYGDLELEDGIVANMNKIDQAGIRIVIMTDTPGADRFMYRGAGESMHDNGTAQRVRKAFFKRMKLPVNVQRDLKFMRSSEKKWKMSALHIPLAVDDNQETAVGISQTGSACILIPKPYNEGVMSPGVLRLTNPSTQLAPAVIDFFKKLDAAGVLE